MELVYLWVEKYKNIHEQGFNFSPRFNCHYEDGILTINENLDEDGNKKYIENFFGDNINVTAIVGKNGSGKSALVFQNNRAQKRIKIYFNNNIIYIEYLNFYKNKIPNFINHTDYSQSFTPLTDYSIYFNWDILKPIYINDHYAYWFTLSNPNILLPLFSKMNNVNNNTLDLQYFDIEIMKKIIQFSQNFSFQTFIYKPYFIEIIINREKKEELEAYKIGKILLNLVTDKERKMKFYNFFNLYYQENESDIIQLLNEKLLSFKIIDKENRDFFDLSHGERSIFLTNLILFDKLKEKNRDIIIYLDEPDLTLHPEWQKKYINELINTFSLWNKKIHFIITSHSPFLLSDLPKENIIFLKDGKSDKGINHKQTFGANIHTLLTDSFFMEGGLMGEFAKQKINEIIAFFDNENELYKNDQEKLLKIINFIGEPFLKDKLLFMYNEKYPKTDEEKILELEKQIASIKNGQN